MFTEPEVQAEFDRLMQYFPQLDQLQQQQFAQLFPLYNDWNARINVISRKDINHLYLHHVLHALSIAKVCPFLPGTDILDMGCGGGFPGIPLAILFPKTQFYLVDSIGKKVRVVQAVADSLGLKNVRAEHIRAEKARGRYDFAISRAVAPLKQLYQWSRSKIKRKSQHELFNGLLCLKGGNLQQEVQEVDLNYATYRINDYFEEDYFREKFVLYAPL